MSESNKKGDSQEGSKKNDGKYVRTRMYTFDFIRNITTILMILVHLFSQATGDSFHMNPEFRRKPTFFEQFAAVFGSGVSFFFFLPSAIVNAFALSKRMKSKKNSLETLTMAGFVKAFFFYPFHFLTPFLHVKNGVFINCIRGSPSEWDNNLIEGLLYTEPYVTFFCYFLFTALLFYFLLCKDRDLKNIKFHCTVLLILGNLIFFLTIPATKSLTQYINVWKTEDSIISIIKAMIFSVFVYPISPVFPFLGHALFGSFFGIMIALYKDSWYLFSLLIPFCTYYMFSGYSFMITRFGYFYPGLITESSERGFIFVRYLRTFQFGVGMLIVLTLYFMIDFMAFKKIRNIVQYINTKVLWNVGNISMSIYVIESLVKCVYRYPFEMIFPKWEFDRKLCVVFGLPYFVFWILVAKYWKKWEYKLSFEWWLSKTVQFVTGKK